MSNTVTPAKVGSNDELGPVVGVVLDKSGWPVLTGRGNEDAYIRHYGGERVYSKAAVAAERERCLHWCSLGDSDGYAAHHIREGTPKDGA